MPLPEGTQIGPYQVGNPLGAGGMGEVYRARDHRLGRDVAIKILSPAFAADPERLARFRRGQRPAGRGGGERPRAELRRARDRR